MANVPSQRVHMIRVPTHGGIQQIVCCKTAQTGPTFIGTTTVRISTIIPRMPHFLVGRFGQAGGLAFFVAACLVFRSEHLAAQAAADFPDELRARALAATVRVCNPAEKKEGSGVIVGRTGSFVYVLTAHHIVTGADGIEIFGFPRHGDPKASKIYRDGQVVAKAADLRDLALIRIRTDDKMLSI